MNEPLTQSRADSAGDPTADAADAEASSKNADAFAGTGKYTYGGTFTYSGAGNCRVGHQCEYSWNNPDGTHGQVKCDGSVCNGDIVYYDGNTHSYSNVPQGSAGESRYNCDSGCRQTVQNTGFGTICEEGMRWLARLTILHRHQNNLIIRQVIANSKDSGKTKSPGKPHTPEQRNFKDLS